MRAKNEHPTDFTASSPLSPDSREQFHNQNTEHPASKSLGLSRRHFGLSSINSLSTLLATVGIIYSPSATHAVESSETATGRTRNGLFNDKTTSTQMVVDVRDFGAAGDGRSDDAPAINAAIRAVRDKHTRIGAFDFGCRISFPTGVYIVNSSINLTELRSINTVIDGGGSAIVGRCPSRPVIDALGSRWLTIRDLTILGDAERTPDIGIQLGVLSAEIVADDHRFEDLKVLGSFSIACVYNRGAETCGFDHLLLWNDHPNSFCLVQDGMNHFGVKSQFAPSTVLVDHDLSFNENEFINCDFRHGSGGTPVWLADTARHDFIRCYAATDSGPTFIIFCGPNSHKMLDIDCHCETSTLTNVFLITGPSEHITIRGFSYKDHECFAAQSVFACTSSIKNVSLQSADIKIARLAIEQCVVFDDPNKWQVSGTYYAASETGWNGGNAFKGVISIGSAVTFVGSVAGRVSAEATRYRPDHLSPSDRGLLFFDRTLSKLIVWSGSEWLDTLGHKP